MGFSLILGFPELNLRLGLGQGLQDIILLLGLFVNLHPQVLGLRDKSLELGEQRSTVTGLAIRKLLGVLELGAQGDLVLLQSTNSILSLLNLAGQILRLRMLLVLCRRTRSP